MSFEVILPFLRPIEHLILDDSVSEVMVNGTGKVSAERAGQLQIVRCHNDAEIFRFAQAHKGADQRGAMF